MEVQLVERGFDYVRKRKKWVFILCAAGLGGYGVYRVYHAPSIARKRKRVSKLLGAMVSVAEAVSESADTIGIVSRDMKEFLQSDSDQVPNSLKQISKIVCSEQLAESLVSVTRAVTVGVLRGYQSMDRTDGDQSGAGSTLVDRVLDKMLTPAGSGFASVVLGSFARNLVLASYSDSHTHFGGESNSSNATGDGRRDGSNSDQVGRWVDVVCGDRCGELIGNCVQLFVSTAVAVYLDKTMHINTYDDFFAGLTNPKHETRVRDMLVSACNGAVETLVKTSHHVLTSSNTTVGSKNESGWVSKVSSTLAIPSNRRLVLDVTGRVTFETVRSFMEFLLQTFCASVTRCAHIVHEAVIEILRYVAAKSSVIVTICLSLCLHIMGGGWALVPA
ncbi:protein PHLOEM PROTEIN 2-LIKE A10-like isoform X2 [Abrus precatorius]|uniref:Protein PHLOEM PROTEIN 2-LIKE A10-like isoform X2 n=1 Tax=Abrus precatorius TaxID=3816 RepID=A0A8B8LXH8_ABRPR|nr:protein PHLOEM PROTEIN 2-LIKE A10-like isoform X2 [Abrus precatorius]